LIPAGKVEKLPAMSKRIRSFTMRALLLSMVFFPWAACSPKVATTTPSPFDEDLPHGSGCNGEEVGAVGHVEIAAVEQARPGLVHERCRLQRVILALAAHVPPCRLPQLLVHDLDEHLLGAAIPGLRGPHEARHGVGTAVLPVIVPHASDGLCAGPSRGASRIQ